MAKYKYAYLDFETRSHIDLPKCGADVYARSEGTDVLCLGYAFDEGDVSLWKQGDHFPPDVLAHIKGGGLVVAHNAIFEYLIWNHVFHARYNLPELKPEQLIDTMAMAYSMSLPGALANAAPALGLHHTKDMTGQRVMLKLSTPRNIFPTGEVTYYDKAHDEHKHLFEKMYEYCKQDVVVERDLFKRLCRLNEQEEKVFQLDLKINQRGVCVDYESAKYAIKLVEIEQARLNKEMQKLTKNMVGTCSAVGQLMDYLAINGIKTEGVTKSEVAALLEQDLPDNIRKVLLLRQEAAKTSTAKLNSMVNGVCWDGRIRGMFQYHGASTGRWAGRRLQLQNFPRPNLKQDQIEKVFELFGKENYADVLGEIDLLYGAPLQVISDCLRGFIIPQEGNKFICADFSAIEARVLAWLAGEEKILNVFRTHGKIYEAAASDIYRVPIESVTKAQRQVGKTAVLALGYGGGIGSFKMMAKNYGVNVGDEEADKIKNAWRQANNNIVKYWYDLENAAKLAVTNSNTQFSAGFKNRNVTFKKSGSFLFCKLPSNRVLCYPYPLIQDVEMKWGEKKASVTYMGEDTYTRKWERLKTYGGKLAENITQAVARDLLANSLVNLENKNYSVAGHFHDEILCEVQESFGSLKEMEYIMENTPVWAKDLPIKAEGWEGFRYRK